MEAWQSGAACWRASEERLTLDRSQQSILASGQEEGSEENGVVVNEDGSSQDVSCEPEGAEVASAVATLGLSQVGFFLPWELSGTRLPLMRLLRPHWWSLDFCPLT